MSNIIKTKISKGFQTVVPAEIRSRFHGEPGDEIIWSIIGDDIYIRIKSQIKPDSLKKIVGKFETETEDDATANLDVELYGKK